MRLDDYLILFGPRSPGWKFSQFQRAVRGEILPSHILYSNWGRFLYTSMHKVHGN